MEKKLYISGGIILLIAIVLGAMGAHALKKVLTPDQLQSFETGIRYQIYHGFFLIILPNISLLSQKSKALILKLVIIGILMFSGSIYLLNIQEMLKIKLSFLGPVTPIGGLILISTWIYFLIKIYQFKILKD